MRLLFATVLAAGALIAAGCGGDGSSDSNGVAEKSAAEIVSEAASALEDVKSFRVVATQGRAKVTADIEVEDKNLRLAISDGDTTASIIAVRNAVYIRANEEYWRDQNVGPAAPELAGKWLKSPSSTEDLRDLTGDIDPQTLSRCLRIGHGTLQKGETENVGGQEAVVVIDKGDKAGGEPGKLWVATDGEPLPLRTLATGNERPGGKKDPQCDEGDPTRKGDEARFSRYNESLDIKAPPGAIDLSAVGTQS